ncbi:universal stress protein [Roseofilum casamattae]|uniref:Universal stress protein n=1 Tax=Roseofilum casamattae BLCC-M143 TaxID=3022442 RepID=A0ABT7BRW2_9CYAN|nr:universal stress protein [Roseofilum casamattae]MDJ1181938.1 universal stress protein [Roseofilum casamattae BLCC-M143]
MKEILLCTDGSAFCRSSYDYAAWVAARLQASIRVLYVTDARKQAAAEARNFSGSLSAGASKSLLDRLVSLEQEKARLDREHALLILQEAKEVLQGLGIAEVETIHETGFLVDFLEQLEANADLIILGKRGEAAQFASAHLGSNVERIIRASYKPCLVTPEHFCSIERILLAYDGSPSCQKMLQFTMDFPLFQGLKLSIVTVGKHLDDESAIAHLEEAKERATSAGFAPICNLLEGHPEEAIARYAQAEDIHLLMMGAYGHKRIRHLVIGSTTTQILRRCDRPVLLFR